jgi:hypothetical protein
MYQGPIKKLLAQMNNPIDYYLPIGEHTIHLNTLLGKEISLRFAGGIYCIQCNRKTAKSFQQGYCYPCYRKLHECNLCMIYPEKCNYPKTDCPDTWEHAHCKQEHIIYLANSSELKVGITRVSQIPTRWIDQGASQAIALFKVGNRYQAGVVEVLFKQFVPDKTNWRKMLKGEFTMIDMGAAKEALLQQANSALFELHKDHNDLQHLVEADWTLRYPILQIPQKLTAFTFDKQSEIQGTLLGIKGQYLLLDSGVLNIRKHAGYSLLVSY